MTPATLSKHDSSHSIKAWLQVLLSALIFHPLYQGMTQATPSRHDSNYSVKGWLQPLSALFQPLYQGELQSLHKGMTRPITPAKHYLTTPSRYYSKALFIGLSQAITSRHSSKSPSRHDLYPSFKQLLYLLETNQPVQNKVDLLVKQSFNQI